VATDHSFGAFNRTAIAGLAAITFAALILVSRYSYLLFHSLSELFSIVIGVSVFVLAWNARKVLRSGHLIIISTAFLSISFVDILHTLAYKGMGVFPGFDANLPTQLWVGARYLQAAFFLGAGILARKRVNPFHALLASAAATAVLLISIFGWKNFPVCYVPGVGLTPFKKVSEYIIAALFALSGLLIYWNRRLFEERVRKLLIWSIVVMIAAELAFTLYVGVYDFPNLIGHLLKIIAYYLIYRAILVTGIVSPFDVLFREIRMGEQALQQANQTLEATVEQRTAELAETIKRLEIEVGERSAAEGSLRLSIRRLKALRDIDLAISSSLDPQLTLDMVASKVIDELAVDAAAILVMNQISQTLEYGAGQGFRTSALRHTRIRVGEGFAGEAAKTRKIVFVDDLETEVGPFSKSHDLHLEGFSSYCAVPLLSRGRVQGVLEVFKRDPMDHSEPWLEFLQALAGQAVIAIENSALFDGLMRSNQELLLAYDATIEGWSTALELRDVETQGHTLRVTEMTLRLSKELPFPADQLVNTRRGALLHDIGKLAIPDSILLKPAPLTEDEWRIMRKHPEIARDMLGRIDYLRPALNIPYCHHEKWDGTGYPRRLSGEEIPFSARVFAVVDVFDALTSDRPYRPAWTTEQALAYIRDQAGCHFDPQIAEIFVERWAELLDPHAYEADAAFAV
jgi:HD-GYP domain-containing protein (c-di-GMP phosphodiesterase class II)